MIFNISGVKKIGCKPKIPSIFYEIKPKQPIFGLPCGTKSRPYFVPDILKKIGLTR